MAARKSLLVSAIFIFCVVFSAYAQLQLSHNDIVYHLFWNNDNSSFQLKTMQEKFYAQQCNQKGNKWSIASRMSGYSPVSYCLTPTLEKKSNECHKQRNSWIWNSLNQTFECHTQQDATLIAAAGKHNMCNGTWQVVPAPPGGYSLTYCASGLLLKERAKCLANQGEWGWNGMEYKMSCYIPPEVTECKAKGNLWITNRGRFPICMSDEDIEKVKKEEENCKKDGGKWGPQGLAAVPGCVRYYNDADKACIENSDCKSGKCLVDKTTKDHGKCHGNSSPFGCFTFFKKGAPGLMGMCVD